ncbi:MAG: hypothetical protein ACKV2T_19600 [Kofleriaceae bacterium]
MLSRLASRGSFGWLFATGLVAGIASAVVLQVTTPAPVAKRTHTCAMKKPQVRPACSPKDELIRATAVIHFFDNEVEYATADDPMSAKAVALLELPMACTSANSHYSYPALSRHIESAAIVAHERGDTRTAMRLVDVGRAYRVDGRMLDTLTSTILE